MKEGSQHVAVIAEAIELAGAWQVEMRREGLKIQRESVVLKDDHGMCKRRFSLSVERDNLSMFSFLYFYLLYKEKKT